MIFPTLILFLFSGCLCRNYKVGACLFHEDFTQSGYSTPAIRTSLELGLEIVNMGLPNGHTLSLNFSRISNSSSTPEMIPLWLDTLDRWNNDPEVIAIIGPQYSTTMLPTVHLLEKPTLGFSVAGSLTENPFFFRLSQPGNMICEAMMTTLFSLGRHQTILIEDRSDGYGQSLSDDCFNAAERNLMGIFRISQPSPAEYPVMNETFFRHVAVEIKKVLEENEDIDLSQISVSVVQAIRYGDMDVFVQFCQIMREEGLLGSNTIPWVFSDTFSWIALSAEWTPEAHAAFDGIAFASNGRYPYSKWSHYLSGMSAFGRLHQENFYISVTYDAVLALGKAVGALLSRDDHQETDPLDNDLLIGALYEIDFLGTTGRITYAEAYHGERSYFKSVMMSVDTTRDEGGVVAGLPVYAVSDWSWDTGFSWAASETRYRFPSGDTLSLLGLGTDSPLLEMSWSWLPDVGHSPESSAGACGIVYVAANSDDERVVLYGGRNELGVSSTMYAQSCLRARWIQMHPSLAVDTRPPSADHSCEFHPGTRKMYVFGGFGGEDLVSEDLWAFQFTTIGGSWENVVILSGSPPPARMSSSFLLIQDKLLLFGGRGENALLNDMYSYNPWDNSWTEIEYNRSIPFPLPREQFTAATYRDELLIWGGRTSMMEYSEDSSSLQSNEFWRFNISTLSWSLVTQRDAPQPRFSHGGLVIGDHYYVAFGRTFNDTNTLQEGLLGGLHRADLSTLLFTSPGEVTWSTLDLSASLTPRFAFSMVLWETFFLIYGGETDLSRTTSSYRKDLWTFDTLHDAERQVHEDFFSPTEMSRFITFQSGVFVYTFGGLNNAREPSNELRRFNSLNYEWEDYLELGIARPKARSIACGVSVDGRLFLFGGLDVSGIPLSDLWIFSPFAALWTEAVVSPDNSILPVAMSAHSCAPYRSFRVIVVGGWWTENRLAEVSRFYVFDVVDMAWSELTITNDGEGPSSLLHCNSFTMGDDLYLEGCSSPKGPLDRIWVLRISLENGTGTWVGSLQVPVVYRSSLHSLVQTGPTKFAYLGGRIDPYLVSNIVVQFDTADGTFSELHALTASSPLPREGHSCEYMRGRLYCFGGRIGERAVGQKAGVDGFFSVGAPKVVSADVWSLHFGSLCAPEEDDTCASCAPGTFVSYGVCLPCPKGYYSTEFNAMNCTPCPPGFFGTFLGAQNPHYCYPCEEGTFNPDSGKTECETCPPTQRCPLGSASPAVTTSEHGGRSYQHSFYEQNAAISTYIYVAALAVGVILWAVVVAFILLLWACKCLALEHLLWFDFLYLNAHDVVLPGESEKDCRYVPEPVARQKTFCGALFSSLAIFIMVAMFAVKIATYFSGQDDYEVRSLVPIFIRESYSEGFLSDLIFRGTVRDYFSDCDGGGNACANGIVVDVEGLSTPGSVSCVRLDATSCQVTYRCEGCAFAVGTTSRVSFQWKTAMSFASRYEFHVSATTGYAADSTKVSLVNGSLLGETNRVFRGAFPTSVVRILAVSSRYVHTTAIGQRDGEGYWLEYLEADRGSQVSHLEFHEKNGLTMDFEIENTDYILQTQRMQTETLYGFILIVIASVFGVKEVLSIILECIENCWGCAKFPNTYQDFKKTRSKWSVVASFVRKKSAERAGEEEEEGEGEENSDDGEDRELEDQPVSVQPPPGPNDTPVATVSDVDLDLEEGATATLTASSDEVIEIVYVTDSSDEDEVMFWIDEDE